MWTVLQCTATLYAGNQWPPVRFVPLEGSRNFDDINALLLDKNDFLWFSCNQGLIRYDGSDYLRVMPDTINGNLPSVKITALFEDSNSTIWVGTANNGLYYYEYKTDRYTRLQEVNPGIASAKWPAIHDLQELNGNLLIAADSVLNVYNLLSKKLTSIYFRTSDRKNVQIVKCLPDPVRKNILWVFTSGGLFELNLADNKYNLSHSYGASRDELGNYLKTLHLTPQGVVYTATKNKGLIEFTPALRSLKIYPFSDRPSPVYSTNNIDGIYGTNEQFLYIATQDSGLALFDVNTKAYKFLKQDNFPESDFFRIAVTAFGGNGTKLALATQNKGIFLLNSLTSNYTVYPLLSDYNKVPGTLYARSLYADPLSKKIYVGSFFGDGLYINDMVNGQIRSFPFIKNKPRQEALVINHIYKDDNGLIWLASHRNGILIFDSTQQQIIKAAERFPVLETVLAETIYSIHQSKDRQLYFSVSGEGLIRMNAEQNKIEKFSHDPGDTNSLASNKLFGERLVETTDGNLWVPYMGGISVFEPSRGSFYHFVAEPGKHNSIAKAFWYSVAQDDSNYVYIGTNNGVYRILPGARTINGALHIAEKDGLLHNQVYSIVKDKRGMLWITCRNGISCYNPSTRTCRNFTYQSGLPQKTLMAPMYHADDGKIYHGGVEKFFVFNPEELLSEAEDTRVWFTSFKVYDQEKLPGLLLNNINRVDLSHKENFFSFSFTHPGNFYPDGIRYSCMLIGIENEWQDLGKRNYKSYTNIAPGQYTFKVRAANKNGTWSNNVKQVIIVVNPPFWKTPWFISLCVVAAAFAGYRLYRFLTQKYETQKTLNRFITALYGKTTPEEIFRSIAYNCIHQLGFTDCVVYQVDEERRVLVQKAAAGPKSPEGFEIINPMEIPLGKGIVGTVAITGKTEIVNNTASDIRYIVDDEKRYSEIAVPILVDGTVYGIIDSEHRQKRFYKNHHRYILESIANICAIRITKYLTEEKLRSKIARDLHDDMGSTLSSINIISKMALQNNDNDAMAKEYLLRIKDNSGRMLESMSDIVWAINPANDTGEKLVLRMKEFAAEILEPLNIGYTFRELGDFSNTLLNLNQRKDFYLVYKEAINNSAKYSQCTEIEIEITKSQERVSLKVKDNGIGFDKSNMRLGNGIKNMEARATAMKAELTLAAEQGVGVTIYLDVPVYKNNSSHD